MSNNEIPVKWSTYIFAPRHFSVRLISGECFWYYTEEAGQGLGFATRAGGGWRSTGVLASGGSPPSLVKLPLGVQLTWLSHTEHKYYQARITLPRSECWLSLQNASKLIFLKNRKKLPIQLSVLP